MEEAYLYVFVLLRAGSCRECRLAISCRSQKAIILARRRQHRPRNLLVLRTSFFSFPYPHCRRRESGVELTGALLKKPTVLAAIAFVALAQA